MSLAKTLLDQLGGERLGEVSRALGADRAQTEKAMSLGLPMILGALAKNASKGDGAESLRQALERDHDGSLLDNLSGFMGKAETSPGDGILKHVLGGRRQTVENAVSASSGLDADKTANLMSMLAPVVMAALGNQRKQGNLDARDLTKMLSGEKEAADKAAPGLGGLAGLLDRDGDGSALDDVAGMAKGVLGSFLRDRN